MNTELKYRTFDELIDTVSIDLKLYDAENFIEPQSLIPVARKINHLLGVKVAVAKEQLITVYNGVAKLPCDFDVLNFSFVCKGSNNCEPEKIKTYIAPACPIPEEIIEGDCGDIVLTPRVQLVYESYGQLPSCMEIRSGGCKVHSLTPIKMVKNKCVTVDSYNLTARCEIEGFIKDNHLVVNFDEGEIYINYQSLMENEDGELLVLDHPRVNDFYEYSLKERILENLLLQNEAVARVYQLYAEKTRVSRIEALSYIRTPDFSEMRQMWEVNRKAMMYKYYSMFK